jgi:hypothetical protein
VDDAELLRGGAAYLADGAALGLRLMYVADDDPAALHADLEDLPGRDALIAAGQLALTPLRTLCDPAAGTDADALFATYGAATDQALADGYAGIRILAEVTPLVRDPRNWEAHVRWEARADRFMAERPFSALCCYDARRVAPEVLHDLGCAHPASVGGGAPFHLRAERDHHALTGEVDFFAAATLGRLLDHAGADRVDVSGLEFADHHALRALARVRVEGASPALRRTAQLLGTAL